MGVIYLAGGYQCKDWQGCGFKVYKTMAGREISNGELAKLLETRRTEVLSGFKSKAGSPFRAALMLNEQWEVKFEFAN